ncbi:MAG: CRISPR-associated protein Cas4 [Thermoplasmata archaeon]
MDLWNIYVFIAVILILLILSILAYIHSKRSLKRIGLRGNEIYADMEIRAQTSLYSETLGLVGKPDRITRQGNEIIVWEFKSREAPAIPFNSHIMQLAAYAILAEEKFKTKVDRGFIRYSNRTFEIEIDSTLKERVIELIKEIQRYPPKGQLYRNHNDRARCLKCEYREICKYSLI